MEVSSTFVLVMVLATVVIVIAFVGVVESRKREILKTVQFWMLRLCI